MFDFLLSIHMPKSAFIRYRAGLLDRESSELLETHLMLCPTCQLQLENLPVPIDAPRFPRPCSPHRLWGSLAHLSTDCPPGSAI